MSSLRRGHANLLCIVPILTDDLRRESESNPRQSKREATTKHTLWKTAPRTTLPDPLPRTPPPPLNLIRRKRLTFELAPGHGHHSPHRLVVRTSRCGRDNPGSTPGGDTFALHDNLTALHARHVTTVMLHLDLQCLQHFACRNMRSRADLNRDRWIQSPEC